MQTDGQTETKIITAKRTKHKAWGLQTGQNSNTATEIHTQPKTLR